MAYKVTMRCVGWFHPWGPPRFERLPGCVQWGASQGADWNPRRGIQQGSPIAKPTTAQVSRLLRALADHGVSVSHPGKSDPPRKFRGSVDEAVSMVLSGTDLTNWTFAGDAARKLDFDFQIHTTQNGRIRRCQRRVLIWACLISSQTALLARLICSSQFEVFPAEVKSSLGRLFM